MIPEAAVKAATVAIYLGGGATMPESRAYAIDALEAAAPHLLADALKLADKWQADFPYKAQELRSTLGVTND